LTRPRWLLSLFGAALCLLPAFSWGANAADDPANAIVGDWLVESRDAVIHIERHGNEFEGHIAWQLHNTYGPEDGPELNGKLVLDRNNPDPAKRSRPLDGLRLIWDLRYDPDRREWRGGRVYDADDGHTYNCMMHMVDADHLRLRGYFGITLIGGSSTWTRVSKVPPF
jgi:uncharacterized protein (DUF2147 family)